MRVRGLLFDLGGTLFSYTGRRRMGGAIADAVAGLGIEAEPEDIGRAWGKANQETMARYAREDYFLHRDLFHDTLSAFAEQFDKPLGPNVADRFHAAQRQAIIDHLPIRDDTHDTLEALKSRGLYLSIVSNIDDDYLHPLVERHGLDRWLDHWTSSEEARSCKPHTAIYHYFLKKAEDDVTTPLTSGLSVTAEPDYQINTLTELIDIVDRLNG